MKNNNNNKKKVQILEFGDCCRLSVKFIPETVRDRVNLSTSCQKLSAHSIQRQLTTSIWLTSKLSLVRLYRYVEPWEIWVKPITGHMRVTPRTIPWKWRLRDFSVHCLDQKCKYFVKTRTFLNDRFLFTNIILINKCMPVFL